MGLGRLSATTPSDAWPFKLPGDVSVRNFTSPFLAAPRAFQPEGNCGPLTAAGTVDRTAVATGFEAAARTVFSATGGIVTEGPATGAGTVDRIAVATGFEAAARTVFSATRGTVTEAETLSAFKGFAVVIVCEVGVAVFEGGAGIVTATGAETVALTKRGAGAIAGVGSLREAGGIIAAGTDVDAGPGAGGAVTATVAGTVPGIDDRTSSGAGIETGAVAALANATGMIGISTDLRCAMIAASCRLFIRSRAIRAR